MVWLQEDAHNQGLLEWVKTYKDAIQALPAAQVQGGSSGKGSTNRGGWSGGGRGRGGGAMNRGGRSGRGGKGGRGGGTSGAPGNTRSLRNNRPAPGHFQGMQALTLSDPANHPPAPHLYPSMHPYPYQYYNPYMQTNMYATHPPQTNATQTNVTEVASEDAGVDKEEESVGGWDESGQVATDVEDDPQHNTWADSSSYETHYGGAQGEGGQDESYY